MKHIGYINLNYDSRPTCINCLCVMTCSEHKTCEEGMKARLTENHVPTEEEFLRNPSLGKRKQLLQQVKKELLTDKLIR